MVEKERMIEHNHTDKESRVIVYCGKAEKVTLLKAGMEKSLFQKIELGRRFQVEQEKGKDLIEKEIWAIKNGQRAWEKLICSNRGLAISEAKKFLGWNLGVMDFEDLIQEGIIGLILAVDNFDWRRDCKFSTYATPKIRAAIRSAIYLNSSTISIPVRKREEMWYFLKEKETLDKEVEPEKVDKFSRIFRLSNLLSLSLETFDQKGDFCLYEDVKDEKVLDPEGVFLSNEAVSRIEKRLSKLSKKKQMIGVQWLGLSMSLEEIGKEYGITANNVWQIKEGIKKELQEEFSMER